VPARAEAAAAILAPDLGVEARVLGLCVPWRKGPGQAPRGGEAQAPGLHTSEEKCGHPGHTSQRISVGTRAALVRGYTQPPPSTTLDLVQ
jgi:hypothetical protein